MLEKRIKILRKMFSKFNIIVLLLLISMKLIAQLDTSKYFVFRDTVLKTDTVLKDGKIYIVKNYHIKIYIKKKHTAIADSLPTPDYLNEIGFMSPSKKKIYVRESSLKSGINFSLYHNWTIRYPANEFLDTILNGQNSMTFSLTIPLYYKGISCETGINLDDTKEFFNFQSSIIKIDSSLNIHISQHMLMNIDTIWYMDLDSLIVGDTVWRYLLDTSLQALTDTLYYMQYDTTQKNYNYSSINSYKFIEIPFIFGYEISWHKFLFIPEGGIIFSFFVSSNGKFMTDNFSLRKIEDILKISKKILWIYSGIKVNYNLGKGFNVGVGSFCRFPLNYYYRYYDNSYKIFKFGLKINFSYKF